MHSSLSHENILQLLHYFEDFQFIYLVMELCETDMFTFLKSRVLSEDESRMWLEKIIRGLVYLHQKSIIHRDLKLSNILIKDNQIVFIFNF